MKFVKTKCIEITKSEYDDIKFIWEISTCFKDACDNVIEYLIKDHRIDIKETSYSKLRDMAHNLVMAVLNDYKYLTIIYEDDKE